MTKPKAVFSAVAAVLTAACAVVFAGCGYKPEDGAKYYKVDDIYRVIELDEPKTRTIKDCGIEDLTGANGPSVIGNSYRIKVDHWFYKNSLFFKSKKEISSQTAECVYDYLGVERYHKLTDEYFVADSGESLYTFNGVYGGYSQYYSFDEWDKPQGVVYGFVSDVTEYTFNFVDYDKRGNEVGSGTFTAILCTETPRTGFFEINQYIL